MLLCIALVHVQSGALDRAGSLLGYVDAVLNRTGVILFPMLRDIRDQIRRAHNQHLENPTERAERLRPLS